MGQKNSVLFWTKKYSNDLKFKKVALKFASSINENITEELFLKIKNAKTKEEFEKVLYGDLNSCNMFWELLWKQLNTTKEMWGAMHKNRLNVLHLCKKTLLKNFKGDIVEIYAKGKILKNKDLFYDDIDIFVAHDYWHDWHDINLGKKAIHYLEMGEKQYKGQAEKWLKTKCGKMYLACKEATKGVVDKTPGNALDFYCGDKEDIQEVCHVLTTMGGQSMILIYKK